jgi:hypothetical protein
MVESCHFYISACYIQRRASPQQANKAFRLSPIFSCPLGNTECSDVAKIPVEVDVVVEVVVVVVVAVDCVDRVVGVSFNKFEVDSAEVELVCTTDEAAEAGSAGLFVDVGNIGVTAAVGVGESDIDDIGATDVEDIDP